MAIVDILYYRIKLEEKIDIEVVMKKIIDDITSSLTGTNIENLTKWFI